MGSHAAQDAQGVLFIQNTTMTPLVYVAATGHAGMGKAAAVPGTVALAWYLAESWRTGNMALRLTSRAEGLRRG